MTWAGPPALRGAVRTGPDRRSSPAGFGVIWTTVAIDQIGFGMVLPILGIYARRLGASAFEAIAIVAAYSLAAFLLSPVLGSLSDRVGRKPVLVVSLLGTAVGGLLSGLAGSLWVLYLGRVLDGLSGPSQLTAQAAVTDMTDGPERARLLGRLGSAFAFGIVVGPGLAALLALVDPRLPFFIAAALAGGNALVALWRLPETRWREEPRTTPVAGPAASARAALNPLVARLLVVAAVAMLAFSGFEASFSVLGQDQLGFDEATSAAVFMGVGLALGFVQLTLVGAVTDRLGDQGGVRLGLISTGVGFCFIAAVGGWAPLVVGLGFLVAGQGLLRPSLTSAVSRVTDPRARGAAIGLQTSATGLARILGPLLAAALYRGVGIPAPYLVAAAVVLLALLLVPGRVPLRDLAYPHDPVTLE